MSTNPADIMNLPGGAIKAGARADITIIDPDAEYVVDSALFRSKARNSLFDGWKLKGRVVSVIVNGNKKDI